MGWLLPSVQSSLPPSVCAFASLQRPLHLLRLTKCLSLSQRNTRTTPYRQLTSYIAYYTLASSIYPHRSSILTSQYTFTHPDGFLSCRVTSIYRPPRIDHQHLQNPSRRSSDHPWARWRDIIAPKTVLCRHLL